MDDKPYYELNNAEFLPWFNNFIKKIEDNKSQLPITDEQIDALKARRDSHRAKLDAQIATEQAARAATRNLNDDRSLSNSEISYLNTTFKADKSVPREVIVDTGLKVSEGKTSEPPVVPLDLTVTADAGGSNELKWKRNGNKQNTIFVVEYQAEGETEWKYLTSTNETKFTHAGRKPGQQIAYRVKATRAGQESVYSNVAVAYFKG